MNIGLDQAQEYEMVGEADGELKGPAEALLRTSGSQGGAGLDSLRGRPGLGRSRGEPGDVWVEFGRSQERQRLIHIGHSSK